MSSEENVSAPVRGGRRYAPLLTEPFPPLGGNSLAGYAKGAGFFEHMLEAIATSTSTVDVEMYLWDDDEVGRSYVEALRAAAARGVSVRILVDAMGASEVIAPLDAVQAAGGDVRIFNPFRLRLWHRYFHRTHKKILLCDGLRAFTGGAGFSLHWSSGKREEAPWHDRMFEIRGPVVQQLERIFETDFQRWQRRSGGAPAQRRNAAVKPAPAGTSTLRALRGWPDARDFPATLVAAVRAANRRVWLGSPYFIPPPSLLRALTKALRRGVDVQLILPSGNHAHPLLWHASRRHYAWFLRRNAKIHEFQHGFYHAKLAVIDDTAAILGSSNLDYWSWSRNAEDDLQVSDAPTVALVAKWFDEDRAASREVTLKEMNVRGFFSRLNERIAGWIEDWL